MDDAPPSETMQDLEPLSRRRFLSFAAYSSTAVVGVGLLGIPAVAASADEQPPFRTDPETGYPIFATPVPPKGYVRSALPCASNEYIDVPAAAVKPPPAPYELIVPPYRLAPVGSQDDHEH